MLGFMSFSAAERARLAALLHELGPDAPTLCEGWLTRDLAAHLWVRENDLLAAAGMFVPALGKRLERAMDNVIARNYDELVDDWGRGPGKRSPVRLVDSKMNFAEHFIHLEDVRRANGMDTPREFSHEVEKGMHSTLKLLAGKILGGSEVPVALYPQGLPRIVAADSRGVSEDGSAVAQVSGPVGEILLWVYGRDAAHVEVHDAQGGIRRASL